MRNATQLQLIRNGKIFQAAPHRSSLSARTQLPEDRSSQLPDISQLGRSSQLACVWYEPALARYPVHPGTASRCVGRGRPMVECLMQMLTICSHKKIEMFTNLRPGNSARVIPPGPSSIYTKKKRTITCSLHTLLHHLGK